MEITHMDLKVISKFTVFLPLNGLCKFHNNKKIKQQNEKFIKQENEKLWLYILS